MTGPRPSRRGRPLPVPGTPKPTFKERLQALKYVPKLARMVWETHKGLSIAMGALRLVRGLVPIATLWVAKLIIDGVVEAQRTGGNWRAILPLVGLEIGIVVFGELLSRASMLVDGQLADLFTIRTSVRLMEHAATLDLAQFEDPAFYDHLDRARRQTSGRLSLLGSLWGIAESLVTLATLAAVLLAFSPWLMLLLVVTILPRFWSESHFAARQYSLMFSWTPRRRELDYLRFAGASDETAKEVQLFGLAPWLIDRFRRLSEKYYRENRALAVRRSLVGSALSLLSTAGYYVAYLVIIAQTVTGAITLGTLTFLAASFVRGRDLIQALLSAVSSIHEESLYLRDLFLFFEMKPTIADKSGAPPVPDPIRQGFQFEDVGFQYPGSERWAVRHLSFWLRPGERVALVGENGAGKTTLTKLLARLYDPTEGRILLDGVDLRDYDVESLRRAIGVIFQDFVRYDMRMAENIGVGEIEVARAYLDADRDDASVDGAPPSLTAGPPVPDVLAEAAEKSLASAVIARVPDGWHQMLGRRFHDGVELSGGEWQKVALARSYMREAQLIILDEPTAALDARAEAEVFQRFAALMSTRSAVIISHRFSTVRMADRILVLRNGELVEDGTHDELVAQGGLYAELFSLQAAGYR
ncbi:MAG: ABC transporter ATP-binding protein [Cytophagaceae bacterium]|nr:ABC transporter ATP-binding protein [Gemmatimonadaceae bacterium]